MKNSGCFPQQETEVRYWWIHRMFSSGHFCIISCGHHLSEGRAAAGCWTISSFFLAGSVAVSVRSSHFFFGWFFEHYGWLNFWNTDFFLSHLDTFGWWIQLMGNQSDCEPTIYCILYWLMLHIIHLSGQIKTATSLETMVNKGNHPLLWPQFRLVKYCNWPRYFIRGTDAFDVKPTACFELRRASHLPGFRAASRRGELCCQHQRSGA